MAATYAESFSVKQFMQAGMSLKGCDLLYIVSPTVSLTTSTVLAEFDLNPLELTSCTRLKQFAPLWDKFKWKKLCVTYKAACGTDTQGLLGLSADPDKLDGYSHLDGLVLDQKCSASLHNISSPPNLPFFLSISDKKFFGGTRFMEPKAGSDPRMYTAGKLVLTNQGALTAGTYGRFYLNWEIEFEEPNIDDLVDQTIGIAEAVNSAYVSVTYPWGQYTAMKTAAANLAVVQETNYVGFSSDATLGSVITFRKPGNYLLAMGRTGVGQTTGAFTPTSLVNCTFTWDLDLGFGSGPNFAVANAGGTTSMWIAAFNATEPGAYINRITDGAVTHTTAYTFVAFVAESPEPDFVLQSQVVNMLASLFKGTSFNLSDLNIKTRKPKVNAIGPTSLSAGTISQGDGPAKTIEYASTGSLLGTAVEPMVVEVLPAQSMAKDKKNKSAKSVKLTFGSDTDD